MRPGSTFCGLRDGEWETQCFQFCHGDNGFTHIEPETTHSFLETPLCSKGEIMWPCAGEGGTWELSVRLCIVKQHFVGIISTPSNERGFGHKSKMCCGTLMLLKSVQKNEQTKKHTIYELLVSLLFPFYSKTFPWGIKTQCCQNRNRKTTLWHIQRTKRSGEQHKMTNYIFLHLLLRSCTEVANLRKRLEIVQFHPTMKRRSWSSQFARCMFEWFSDSARFGLSETLPVKKTEWKNQ